MNALAASTTGVCSVQSRCGLVWGSGRPHYKPETCPKSGMAPSALRNFKGVEVIVIGAGDPLPKDKMLSCSAEP